MISRCDHVLSGSRRCTVSSLARRACVTRTKSRAGSGERISCSPRTALSPASARTWFGLDGARPRYPERGSTMPPPHPLGPSPHPRASPAAVGAAGSGSSGSREAAQGCSRVRPTPPPTRRSQSRAGRAEGAPTRRTAPATSCDGSPPDALPRGEHASSAHHVPLRIRPITQADSAVGLPPGAYQWDSLFSTFPPGHNAQA